MEEENQSDDENTLQRDLAFMQKRIPREVYEANKEKYEANLKKAEDEDEAQDEDALEEDDEEEEEEAVDESEDEEAADESEDEDAPEETLRTALSEFNDEDDEEEDDDEFYLQKFDENTQKKIISDYHPELQSHNYDEIDVLSRVIRDENGNIIDPLHKTLPFITRYEKARILGERAKQINSGAKPLVELEPNIIDGYVIALKEFEQKKIPFIVKRPLPNGGVEYWKFEDLEILV
jgi:DNA-directed RNA polymerases I, II, and III subunit RPABC2